MRTPHLVTGAAGLIGFALVRQMLERGDPVVAVDRYLKGGREELEDLAREHSGRLELVEADLARHGAASDLEGPFDAIVHLAAIVGVRYVNDHPYDTLTTNLRSTLELTDLALRVGCSIFAVASSSENYAAGVDAGWVPVPTPEDVPLVIDDIAMPRRSYAASKIACESAVFSAAPRGDFTPVVFRFHNVYGPRMGTTHVIPEFVARCLEQLDPFPIHGPEQTRSFLYVDDATRAMLCILDAARVRDAGGIYNVGRPEETAVCDLARLVFEAVGFEPRIEEHPALPGSVARRVPDTSKLEALGFEPRVSLAEGIRRTVEAQRARSGVTG